MEKPNWACLGGKNRTLPSHLCQKQKTTTPGERPPGQALSLEEVLNAGHSIGPDGSQVLYTRSPCPKLLCLPITSLKIGIPPKYRDSRRRWGGEPFVSLSCPLAGIILARPTSGVKIDESRPRFHELSFRVASSPSQSRRNFAAPSLNSRRTRPWGQAPTLAPSIGYFPSPSIPTLRPRELL